MPPNKKDRNFKGGRDRRFQDPDFFFKKDIRRDIMDFLCGSEEKLELAPMNSYRRKLAHEIAREFNLNSSSDGEGEERHNVFVRTEETYKPSQTEIEKNSFCDFGDQEFFVIADPNGIQINLLKDGSFGLFNDVAEDTILSQKTITSGSFKIKNNRVIDFTDTEW